MYFFLIFFIFPGGPSGGKIVKIESFVVLFVKPLNKYKQLYVKGPGGLFFPTN